LKINLLLSTLMIVVCSTSTLDMLVGSVCSRSFILLQRIFITLWFFLTQCLLQRICLVYQMDELLVVLHLLPIAGYALVISVCTNKLTYRVDEVYFDFLAEGLHEFLHLEQLHIVVLDTALHEWDLGALLEFIF
jgi:hypothetical protein